MADLGVNSIVQLLGTKRNGRILNWTEELLGGHRDLPSTHYAIQPIDNKGDETEPAVFWPQSQVCSIEPPTSQEEDIKFRF